MASRSSSGTTKREGAEGRKGLTLESALITIIIFGVVVIIIVIMYNQLFAIGKGQFTEKECQSSLLLTKAVSSVSPTCLVSVPTPIPIKCNRDFVTVKDSSVQIDGKDVTGGYDSTCYGTKNNAAAPAAQPSQTAGQGTSSNTCVAQRAVAEEMRTCWREFFNGEQVVLQQVDTSALKIWKTKDYQQACFICAEVSIKTSGDITNFVSYLQDAPMQGSTQTYYQDLAQDANAKCDPSLAKDAGTCWDTVADGEKFLLGTNRPNIRPDTLTKDKKYLVTFVRRGMGSCEGSTSPTIKTLTHEDLTNTVQLIPADQINNVCDVVLV